MSSYKFYFIHNYKTAGTTIYKQLPESYNNIFYGQRTLNSKKESRNYD